MLHGDGFLDFTLIAKVRKKIKNPKWNTRYSMFFNMFEHPGLCDTGQGCSSWCKYPGQAAGLVRYLLLV
jgi:hypothetical protein